MRRDRGPEQLRLRNRLDIGSKHQSFTRGIGPIEERLHTNEIPVEMHLMAHFVDNHQGKHTIELGSKEKTGEMIRHHGNRSQLVHPDQTSLLTGLLLPVRESPLRRR